MIKFLDEADTSSVGVQTGQEEQEIPSRTSQTQASTSADSIIGT